MSNQKELAVECISALTLQVIGIISSLIHFWLSKNRKICATHYACMQSIVVFVSILEGAMQSIKELEQPDGLLTAATFIACLSTISYNQY
jgi:uncharacterized membrane protein